MGGKILFANSDLIVLPPPLSKDADILSSYWSWLVKKLDVPEGVPYPIVKVEALPANRLMGLVYPTSNNKHSFFGIIISHREINRAKAGLELEVLGNVAHEIVHYLRLLEGHNWNYKLPAYREKTNANEHCNPEFMKMVRHFGSFIWNTYHSKNAVRAINQSVSRSCWEEGQILNK